MKRTALVIAVAIVGLVAAIMGIGWVRDGTENPSQFFSDPTTLALADALLANDRARVEALITEGASLEAQGVDGVTLLQWRLLRDDIGRFIWLLDLGADPNAQGWHGETALHMGAQHQQTIYLEALLDRGANPNAVNRREGQTPLFNAMDAREQKNVSFCSNVVPTSTLPISTERSRCCILPA